MHLQKLFLFVWVVISLCASSVSAQEKPLTAQEQKTQTALFQWLDTHLNLPDLTKASIVKVEVPAWDPESLYISGHSFTPAYKVEYGFLLKEDKDTFTVFFTTTLQLTLRRTKSPLSATYKKKQEKAFLKQWFQPSSKQELLLLGGGGVLFDKQLWTRPMGGGSSADEIDALFFARFYAARGDMQTANRFYRFFLNTTDYQGSRAKTNTKLAEALDYIAQHHLGLLSYDPYLSREAFLGQMRLTRKRFSHDGIPFREETSDEKLLIRMIAEDKEHARKPLPLLYAMPLNARIAELIFRLRDALYFPRLEPPSIINIYPYDEAFKSNPRYNADQELLRIGYPAVPQLIDAFADERFTRGGDRIGGRAIAIFSKITAYELEAVSESHDGNKTANDYKRAALAWWTEYEKNGERRTLIARTAQGDSDSVAFAQRLAKVSPK